MIFAARTLEGDEIRWKDGKRWLWLLAVASSGVPCVTAIAVLASGNPAWSLLTLAIYFGLIPILDMLIGEDPNNPPEEVVEALSSDNWYRLLLFATIPIQFAGLFLSAWTVATADLPWWAFLAITAGIGTANGSALTIGHELGHKQNRLDQWGAKIVNALTGYAHFCIEHNRGHHSLVATPEDPASSRMGESVYAFMLREIPGAAVRGYRMEAERMKRKGLSFWHWRNDILQGLAITVAVDVALILAFGWVMLPFQALHHFIGWQQLTFANYVEHYGLLRRKLPNGRYEACEPRHSWNTNHIVSNLLLFHLQRHSDHHANPLRPYQALRNFEDLPRLPSGYPGSFLLALVPPVWFRVMDPKVMAWAGGDLARVNRVPGYLPAASRPIA
jgi:alkane 1-monooxygenase